MQILTAQTQALIASSKAVLPLAAAQQTQPQIHLLVGQTHILVTADQLSLQVLTQLESPDQTHILVTADQPFLRASIQLGSPDQTTILVTADQPFLRASIQLESPDQTTILVTADQPFLQASIQLGFLALILILNRDVSRSWAKIAST